MRNPHPTKVQASADAGDTVEDERRAREAQCWFEVDYVSGDPETTAWKRKARMRQAAWREGRSEPMGTHPYAGGAGSVPVGSRLDLAYARSDAAKEAGANFLTPGVLAAVKKRLGAREAFQTLNEQRLWADLLSSMPLCFNFFGELDGDAQAAARAVRSWFPDAPGGRVEVRFEHSPGRRDSTFLGNQSAFDVALEIHDADGGRSIIGVETKYHEHAAKEAPPKPAALERYTEVTERSGIFIDGWQDALIGTNLQQIWLDHLLVLSMLQHPSNAWTWGRFVLVHPAENPSFALAAAAYRELLRDASTFEAITFESLLAHEDALPAATVDLLRRRYFQAPALPVPCP